MKDFTLELNNGLAEMSYDEADSLAGNVWLSVNTRYGSWFYDLAFGSKLHTITRLTDNNVALAKDYIVEATKWIVDTARAISIDVITSRDPDRRDQLNIGITAVRNDGRTVSYTLFYKVT